MNPMIQPDVHPDADALSAFAEQALPVADRAQILAHMASCARCREVVYLAQAAAEPGSAPVAATGHGPQRGWWPGALAKWRMAWIPAAALAATGGVLLWVQLRPAPAPTQTAKMSEPQPVPLSPDAAKTSAQLSQHVVVATAPRQSLAVPPRPSGSLNANRIPPTSRPEQKKAMPPAVDAMDANPSAFTAASGGPAAPAPAGRERALGATHLDAHSASMARYAPPPAFPLPATALPLTPTPVSPHWQQQQSAVLSQARAGNATASTAPPPPNIVALSQGPAAGQTTIAAALPPQPELAPQPLNGFAAMHLAKRAKLPSGLGAVSSAALLNRLLAVDSAGAVFLSQDAGKHWEAVGVQWRGKAIQVQAPPQGLNRSGAADAASSEQSPAPPLPPPAGATQDADKANAVPPIPAMLFRLVTDRRQTWVSTDGEVWREQ